MNSMISKENFKKEVIENRSLALVQFNKEWNGACQIVSMIYDDLANLYNGVASFYTVDADKDSELDNEYGIMELPTILFFKNGRIIDHAVGMIPKNILISKIENALINSAN